MEIYVDGELIKETNLEGVITFIDEFQLKDQEKISVKFKNGEIVFEIRNKTRFLQDKEKFLLEIIKMETCEQNYNSDIFVIPIL